MLLPYRAAVIRFIAVTALALGIVAGVPAAHAEEVTKSFTVSGRPNVRVDTNDGSVRVISGNSQEVQFHVTYRGYALNKDLSVDTRQDGDRVELVARIHGHFSFMWGVKSRDLHIEVRMPKAGDLEVSTGDGAVEASSVDGNVNVHTGDGSVKANGLSGTIVLQTGDGSINVNDIKGDIRMHTGDGSIEARGLDGKVNADSGDGHIKLEGRLTA